MARLTPEQQVQRILNTMRGWETHARRSTFTRHSLAEFKAAMRPSLEAHARVVDLRHQLRIAIVERNTEVRTAMELVYKIGYAAKGDPEHGPNSDLCEALGYTREAVRRAKIRRGRRRKQARERS